MNPEALNGIKPGEKILMSRKDQAAVFKFPCDGVERYVLRKTGPRLAYSEAYEHILIETGCTLDEKGCKVLTLDGVARIRKLNEHYLRVAGVFITAWFADQREQREAAAKKAAQAKLPDPDKMHGAADGFGGSDFPSP